MKKLISSPIAYDSFLRTVYPNLDTIPMMDKNNPRRNVELNPKSFPVVVVYQTRNLGGFAWVEFVYLDDFGE